MNQFQTICDKFLSKIIQHASDEPSFDLTINEYKILLNNKIDSLIITGFIEGLKNKNIDIDKLLILLLETIRSDEHLLLISLCIRYGANVNLYINSNGTMIHILVYIYLMYKDPNEIAIKNTIVLLFKFSGSDSKLGYILNSNIDINKYLKNIGIDHILDIDNNTLSNNLDKKLINKIATLLDRSDLLVENDYNLTEIIRDHSSNVFRHSFQNLDLSKIIELCIKYYNLDIFIICLNLGIKLKYHQVNLIALHIKNNIKLIKDIFKNMLIEYIYHNGKIDKYQFKILERDYSVNDFNDFDDNKILDYIINPLLDENNERPVNVLTYLKKYYIESGGTFGLDPRLNQTPDKDYLDISEYTFDEVFFTPDMFEYLLTTKIMPYNFEAEIKTLSDDYLRSLTNQRSLVKRLGYNVNKLKHENCIDDNYFHKMERAFSTLIKINTDNNIDSSSVLEMERTLNDIGVSTYLMNLLNVEHYKRTFAISCYEKLDKELDTLIGKYK